MDKILSYVGLCRKAGKLIPGTAQATDAIRSGKAVMSLLSSDASDNTVKRISDCSRYRGVECVTLPFTSEQLGAAIGKESIAAAAVTDTRFAEMIKNPVTVSIRQHKSI